MNGFGMTSACVMFLMFFADICTGKNHWKFGEKSIFFSKGQLLSYKWENTVFFLILFVFFPWFFLVYLSSYFFHTSALREELMEYCKYMYLIFPMMHCMINVQNLCVRNTGIERTACVFLLYGMLLCMVLYWRKVYFESDTYKKVVSGKVITTSLIKYKL